MDLQKFTKVVKLSWPDRFINAIILSAQSFGAGICSILISPFIFIKNLMIKERLVYDNAAIQEYQRNNPPNINLQMPGMNDEKWKEEHNKYYGDDELDD